VAAVIIVAPLACRTLLTPHVALTLRRSPKLRSSLHPLRNLSCSRFSFRAARLSPSHLTFHVHTGCLPCRTMASSARDRLEAMAADRGPTTILRPVRRRRFAPASARGRGTVARWRRRRTQWISKAGNTASRPTTGVPKTPTSTTTLTLHPADAQRFRSRTPRRHDSRRDSRRRRRCRARAHPLRAMAPAGRDHSARVRGGIHGFIRYESAHHRQKAPRTYDCVMEKRATEPISAIPAQFPESQNEARSCPRSFGRHDGNRSRR